MKNILKIIFILLILSPISFAQESSKSFVYTGYAEIDHKSINDIEASLQSAGCKSQSPQPGECYYTKHMVYQDGNGSTSTTGQTTSERGNGVQTIEITPSSGIFGGDRITVTENNIYYSADIQGPQNEDLFKQQVKEKISKLNNFVSLKESTWSITSEDSTGRVYSSGSTKNLSGLIRSVEFGTGPVSKESTTNYIWVILISLVVLTAIILVITLLKRKRI